MEYLELWLPDCVSAHATTFEDLIECWEAEIERLKSMKADGLSICLCDMESGLARITTNDPSLAEKYAMEGAQDVMAFFDISNGDIEDDDFDDSDFPDEEFDDSESPDDAEDSVCGNDDGHCPECGVGPGQRHKERCDIDMCPYCGFQRLSCGHDVPVDDRLVWEGLWPGEKECIEYGWFARLESDRVLVSCGPDNPEAMPDLNRLLRECRWSRSKKRWVKTRSNKSISNI
jgi:hypothetical protein